MGLVHSIQRSQCMWGDYSGERDLSRESEHLKNLLKAHQTFDTTWSGTQAGVVEGALWGLSHRRLGGVET